MQTDEAKAAYEQRAATIETINGDLTEHRGLTSYRVRGLQPAASALTLCVLAYDLLRAIPIASGVVSPART